MKRIIRIEYRVFLLALLVCCPAAMAQSVFQAQKDFEAENYVVALAAYRSLAEKNPSNPAYNYYAGACCYETGAIAEALSYLEKSAKRNYIHAFRYLGKAYASLYRFDDAIEAYERHISLLKDKKRSSDEAEAELEAIRKTALMYKNVENLTVIDSFVVHKNDFLNVYKIGKESGSLSQHGQEIVYETEMENKMIFSRQDEDGKYRLYLRNKLIDTWSEPMPISSLNGSNNVNYPFLKGDGITLCFAFDGEGSLGGYDIYVTRYDSENNAYLKPDNRGMPFNSPANDYMLVVDEQNELGWFASDRYQPEDSVCVYVFVPNTERAVLDYESTDPAVLRNAATLRSIRMTWQDADKVEAARQRLTALIRPQTQPQRGGDFELIVNDSVTYTALSDFRSADARNLYRQALQKQKDYDSLARDLAEKRHRYEAGDDTEKKQLSENIQEMEQRLKQLYEEVDQLIVEVRNTEISQFKH